MDEVNEIISVDIISTENEIVAPVQSKKSKRTDECLELRNIKYKTMIKNGAPMKETKQSNNLANLEVFLENEKANNSSEPWCKLDKNLKTKKILEFIEKYSIDNSLDNDEAHLLTAFLKSCLDKKKLNRVKDVIYDKTTGAIKEIPALTFTKATKHFTLKNMDKQRVSTLKSLAPKKGQTLKNKADNHSDSE
jgi:hypothetical protein